MRKETKYVQCFILKLSSLSTELYRSIVGLHLINNETKSWLQISLRVAPESALLMCIGGGGWCKPMTEAEMPYSVERGRGQEKRKSSK